MKLNKENVLAKIRQEKINAFVDERGIISDIIINYLDAVDRAVCRMEEEDQKSNEKLSQEEIDFWNNVQNEEINTDIEV